MHFRKWVVGSLHSSATSSRPFVCIGSPWTSCGEVVQPVALSAIDPIQFTMLMRSWNLLLVFTMMVCSTLVKPTNSAWLKFVVIGNFRRTVNCWYLNTLLSQYCPMAGMAEPQEFFPMHIDMPWVPRWQVYLHEKRSTRWTIHTGWVLQWMSQTRRPMLLSFIKLICFDFLYWKKSKLLLT